MDVDDDADDEDQRERANMERQSLNRLPAWAHNLDLSCKKVPMTGLVNCDADETAAQIFDNGIMINTVFMFDHYYRNQCLRHRKSTTTIW